MQDLAAAGHAAIRPYARGFRVVGSTATVNARDNTATTHTTADKGLPIYWLGGNKVADDYADFYDSTWDDEENVKDERGRAIDPDDNGFDNVWTGTQNNGTKHRQLTRGDLDRPLRSPQCELTRWLILT